MQSTASLADLEAAILRAGILSREEWGAALAELLPETREAGPQTVAHEFVRSGRLTDFQRQMLLSGDADGLVLGEYTLLSLLGAGGMGRVFRALHRRMGREVALKVLPERLVAEPQAVERFEREVRVAARLTHPNVVTAYDAGQHAGTHYLVMEFVPGADLATFVKSTGPMPVADALRCTLQVAAGLEYAHQQGVTHRDIKPGNLLLNPQGVVKVLDLGLARMRSDAPGGAASLSSTGAVVGTIDFMPPEQALNAKSADERSDIYSLGCTLYYLLTGRPLYERETLMQKLLAHREAPVPDVREFVPTVSVQLAAALSRMLAKDPAARFAAMPQAAEVLRKRLRECDGEQDLTVRAAALLDSIAPRAASSQETRDYVIERSLMATRIVPQPGETVAVAPELPPKVPRRSTGLRWLLAALSMLLLGAVIVIQLQFADGTLVIEVAEPGARIEVDGQQVATVTSADGQRVFRIEVKPGQHRVKVTTQDGQEFYSNDFIVAAGQETELFRAHFDEPTVDSHISETVPPADPAADGILTVAQDGSAEFTSLPQALAAAVPGNTIRVMDDAEYTTPLFFQSAQKHASIVLEATNGATLVAPPNGAAVAVLRVRGVVVRGFRLRVSAAPAACLQLEGDCAGCTFEDLQLVGPGGVPAALYGVNAFGVAIPHGAPPLVIRACRFESVPLAIRIAGLDEDYTTPLECRDIRIADNMFVDNFGGVSLSGTANDVQVVGNRFVQSTGYGVQLLKMLPDESASPGRGLLVANNTFLDCAGSLIVWDDDVRRTDVTLAANLFLAPSGVDWMFLHSDNAKNPQGPGDVDRLLAAWTFRNNWREASPPTGATLPERSWVPAGKHDTLQHSIDVISRDPVQPGFLQPAADSPLASAAGQSDSLPPFIGAVPPGGAAPWDWSESAAED